MTYRVAVSRRRYATKIADGDVDEYRRLNGSFDNVEVEAWELAGSISEGRPFTTWHAHGWRHGRNYLLGQHIALDFDAASVEEIMADPFAARYGSLVYPTPSSRPDAPRTRLVFLLDTPIVQPANYILCVRALLWLYNHADPKCKDPCRFFYGSKGAPVNLLCNVLPLATARELADAYRATGQAQMAHERRKLAMDTRTGDERLAAWAGRVAAAREGERNDTLYRAAYGCAHLASLGRVGLGEVERELGAAGRACGLGEAEVERTIAGAFRCWGQA